MVKGLYIAYTGMVQQEHRMDVLTNNLANADTNGFKKEGVTSKSFDEVLTYKIKDSSENYRLSKNIGKNNPGVSIGENYVDYSQGAIKETNNPYDLALAGDGFFAVEFLDREGNRITRYTRDGNFTMDSEGYIRTRDGDNLLDTDGNAIKINPNAAETYINVKGQIIQDGDVVSTIQITDFEDYDYLARYGENYFEPVEGATEKEATAQINQGYLEGSNIKVVSEMVDMITVQRAYETNQKVITTIDGTLDIAANQLGKL